MNQGRHVLLLVALVTGAAAQEAMTEVQREEALRRSFELNERMVELYRAGQYDEALAAAEEALALLERAVGAESPDVATVLQNVALMLQMQGRLSDALPRFERALAICEKAHGEEHPVVATCLNNLGCLRHDLGEYVRAAELLGRALAIREKAAGPRDPSVAESLSNLATTLDALGRYEAAAPLLERAIAILAEAQGESDPLVATVAHNLAHLRSRQGNYAAARKGYERALAIDTAAYGEDHPEVATDLNNLAYLLRDLGQYEAARSLAERALAIRVDRLGEGHVLVADSLNLLASLSRAYDEARRLYGQALEIYKTELGEDHPAVANVLVNLGYEETLRGSFESALGLLERALAIQRKAYGGDHPALASVLTNLGMVYQETGRLEEAQTHFTRALALREASLGGTDLLVALSATNLGALLHARGENAAALRLHERALRIVLQVVRDQLAGFSPPARRRLAGTLRWHLDSWLRTAQAAGDSGYGTVLRFKGLVARTTAAERRLTRHADDKTVEAMEDLLAAERRVARLAESVPPFFEKEERERWREAYAAAAAERDSLAARLAARSAAYRKALAGLDTDPEKLQEQLEAGEVLVDYLRSGERYFAWVVPPEGAVAGVDLGEAAAIEEAAAEFTRLAADRETRAGDAAWLEAGRGLRRLVLDPLRVALGRGVRTLYLCPDAALAAVPFVALPAGPPGRHLLDEVLVVQLATAQDLAPDDDEAATGHGAVLVGGVDYDTAANAGEATPAHRPFGPLPASAAEVALVAKQVGEESVVLSGQEATESRLRSEVVGRRIVHLATHGFVRPDPMRGLRRRRTEPGWLGFAGEQQLAAGHDPMLLAGLALAGANRAGGGLGDDGILTALEASHLDLRGVDLVVLSACDTALGRVEAGEGVVGLVRGFRWAGARRVVASLWAVDDESTRLLMQRFYETLLRAKDPVSPAAALREAMRAVRAARGNSPRHWAAFVAYGPLR